MESKERGLVFTWETETDTPYGAIRFHHNYHGYSYYHSHDFYELFITNNGSYHHNINGKEVHCKRLEAILMGLNTPHSITEDAPNSSHYSLSFRKEEFENYVNFLSPTFLNELKEKGYFCFVFSESRLKKIIFYLNQIRESQKDKEAQDVAIKLLFFNILEPLLSQENIYQTANKPGWLNELLVKINDPNNLDWNVADVVAHSNYCKTHLSRLFRKEMGKSIGEYLQEVKINNARDILINSEMSLCEICDLIGHSSLSHFSNIFKKYYGMAPGQYRSTHKKRE